MEWLVGGLIYGLIGILILSPIVFYAFSFASRKAYLCPECGERMTAEYLKAKRCNMCGAPLQQKEY
jgi:hypothetical protein